MADRPRNLADFKGVGHFAAKFRSKSYVFAQTSMGR